MVLHPWPSELSGVPQPAKLNIATGPICRLYVRSAHATSRLSNSSFRMHLRTVSSPEFRLGAMYAERGPLGLVIQFQRQPTPVAESLLALSGIGRWPAAVTIAVDTWVDFGCAAA